MALISPDILDQIKMVQSDLEQNPYFSMRMAKKQIAVLKRSSDRHSVDMELPSGTRNGHRGARRIAYRNLEAARATLEEGCASGLTENCIRKAAARIDGYDGTMIYRTENARAKGYNHTYPNPAKIPNEMFRFVLKNPIIGNPIERAAHSHFHIARIHPFPDGNGRLARLMQNVILGTAELPPIEILPLERKEYCDLINSAEREYRESEGELKPLQARFYNYLALKLRDSLIRIREASCSEKV